MIPRAPRDPHALRCLKAGRKSGSPSSTAARRPRPAEAQQLAPPHCPGEVLLPLVDGAIATPEIAVDVFTEFGRVPFFHFEHLKLENYQLCQIYIDLLQESVIELLKEGKT